MTTSQFWSLITTYLSLSGSALIITSHTKLTPVEYGMSTKIIWNSKLNGIIFE